MMVVMVVAKWKKKESQGMIQQKNDGGFDSCDATREDLDNQMQNQEEVYWDSGLSD